MSDVPNATAGQAERETHSDMPRPTVCSPASRPSRAGVAPGERFVSYAQNLEDVVLWRALGSFGPGFYIDLGAGEPMADSVTKAFYDRGWRGINLEPMPAPFDRLKADRPRDINLCVAVEDRPGRKRYFSVDGGNGLSTGVEELAAAYRAAGRSIVEVYVQTDTLESLCDAYVNHEIHFLKVDVEGSEDLVFKGANLRRYRPWIILVESPEAAAVPRSPEWHGHLVSANYKYVYFDGLNRFYLACEKLTILEPLIATGPSCFDDYIRYTELQLEERLKGELSLLREEVARLHMDMDARQRELDACYQELYEDSRQMGWLSVQRQQLLAQLQGERTRGDDLEQSANDLNSLVENLRMHIAAVERSRSWRLTAPLRATVSLVIRITGRARPKQ